MSQQVIAPHLEASPSGRVLGPRVVAGQYALLRELGSGATGSVYEAEKLSVGGRVALKMLHKHYAENGALRTRFMQEARAAMAVAHENIVDIYDLGTDRDGTPYLVMERLEGETLERVLERGPVSPSYACELLLQILSALGAAHRHGIIHRDLKPANVVVQHPRPHRPVVKVVDFGIAASLHAGTEGATSKGLLGTPRYMAPEQALGRTVDERADLYSAGVILYELLSGHSPFEARETAELHSQVVTGQWVPLSARCPHLSTSLAQTVDRLLSPAANARPRTATEVARALLTHVSRDPGGPSTLSLTSGVPLLLRAAVGRSEETPRSRDRLPQQRRTRPGPANGLSEDALRRPTIPKAPLAPVIWGFSEAAVAQPEGPPPLAAHAVDTSPDALFAEESADGLPSSLPSPLREQLVLGHFDAKGIDGFDPVAPFQAVNGIQLLLWAILGVGIGAALALL